MFTSGCLSPVLTRVSRLQSLPKPSRFVSLYSSPQSSYPSCFSTHAFHPLFLGMLLPGDLWALTPATTHSKEHVPVPTSAHPQGCAHLSQLFTLFLSCQGWLNVPLPPCTVPVPALVYGTADGAKDNSQCNPVSPSTSKSIPPAPRVTWLRESQILDVKIFLKLSRPI